MLDHIHSCGYIHRDLKTENILIMPNGCAPALRASTPIEQPLAPLNDSPLLLFLYVKLADFGFAKRIQKGNKTYTTCGTPAYMAPEIITHSGHGAAVDWWCVGIMLYEMTCGCTPFQGENQISKLRAIVKGNRVLRPKGRLHLTDTSPLLPHYGREVVHSFKPIMAKPYDCMPVSRHQASRVYLCIELQKHKQGLTTGRRCRFKLPDTLSPDCKAIITKLLHINPSRRLGNLSGGSKDVKRHPWFNEFDWEAHAQQTMPVRLSASLHTSSLPKRRPPNSLKWVGSGVELSRAWWC
eukprot:1195263-Prorocentrum_minimum.AAC.2